VRVEEDVAQPAGRHEIGRELLGEHVVVRHGEPRLECQLVVDRARRRQVAEAALRQRRQLVVVVEDHPAMAADAEVLEQQIAGKDVRGREIADRVPVVENGRLGRVGVRLLHEEVERADAPLRVDVLEDDARAVSAHRARREVEQLVEQCVGEAASRKGEPLEELRVGEPADAVAQEDAMILLHHVLPRRALGRPDPVLDDLENDVERREREHRHHQPLHAGRFLETGVHT
jgi:hypothetical protein